MVRADDPAPNEGCAPGGERPESVPNPDVPPGAALDPVRAGTRDGESVLPGPKIASARPFGRRPTASVVPVSGALDPLRPDLPPARTRQRRPRRDVVAGRRHKNQCIMRLHSRSPRTCTVSLSSPAIRKTLTRSLAGSGGGGFTRSTSVCMFVDSNERCQQIRSAARHHRPSGFSAASSPLTCTDSTLHHPDSRGPGRTTRRGTRRKSIHWFHRGTPGCAPG